MNLSTHFAGKVAILELSGRFDAHTAPAVSVWLRAHATVTPAWIVVDVGKVNFMDSTALVTLVQGMKHARQAGGNLHLCNLQHPVRVIFDLTRLEKAFSIYTSEVEAIHAFRD